MPRASAGEQRPKAMILLLVTAILVIATAVFFVRSSSPPGVAEASAAARIATDYIVQDPAMFATQVVTVTVDGVADHGAFWRVTLHFDAHYPGTTTRPAGVTPVPVTIHLEIDVDKHTATPTIHDQG